MNKTLLSIALTTIMGVAHAQSAPAPTTVNTPAPAVAATLPANAQVAPINNTTTQTASPQATKPNEVNPFTNTSKEGEMDQKAIDDLKRQKDMSASKLQLQRDELEALRIEVEKRKLQDTLNPPKVEPVKVAPVKKTKPLPQVIYPATSKNEIPVLVGVVTTGNQTVAMFEHDGKAIRATVGSTVGGQKVNEINANSVKLGDSYLNIPGKKGYPTVALNDSMGPAERKSAAATAGQAPIIANTTPQAVPVMASSAQQTIPGTNVPLINPKGAGSTTNVFGLLPPPPPSAASTK